MDREIWIAVCAHRLQRHWRSVDPALLDEVAGDLWQNDIFRKLAPEIAGAKWLMPVEQPLTAGPTSGTEP